jgi:molybdate transport repressor ModE-like protein/molybdopterin-binding protein
MTRDAALLAPVDVALLDLLSREGNLVAACARLGIGRDRGVYRLRRLARVLGRPAVTSLRGGRGGGSTRLTATGRRVLARGAAPPIGPRAVPRLTPPMNAWTGAWHAAPHPHVDVALGFAWNVDFLAREGERVSVTLDPEAVLVARSAFPTSARNVLEGTVARVRDTGAGTGGERRLVLVRSGRVRVLAAVTDGSVRRLGLAPGRRVVLFVKATALHRGGGRAPSDRATRGSPRSSGRRRPRPPAGSASR